MLGRGHDGKRDISNMKLWNVCFGTVYRERGRRCDCLQITDPHHKVKVKIAQLCPTVCNPMDYTVHGISQARILEWVGEGNGNPLQYSCLENPMDRGAWWAAVHGVA